MQLFESISIVASPGSPGSKPLNMFDPSKIPNPTEPSRTEADLRVAMETAEEQAVVSSQPAARGLREYAPAQERSVKFDDTIQSDPSYSGPQALSQSLRQASIASCASEWVDGLKQSTGSFKKR